MKSTKKHLVRRSRLVFFLLIFIVFSACTSPVDSTKGLWEVYDKDIRTCTFVDLTHAFEPGIPHWKGFPNESRTMIYGYEPGQGSMGNGFLAETYCHVGQWGTHVDPPAHFHKGMRTVDEIQVNEMILPLVVLDAHREAEENPDYTLTMEKVRQWEKKHGTIPEDAFVVMRTDWSHRWPSQAAMQNKGSDGTAHYPGWSLDVLRFLIQERGTVAIGHETTDTDPGISTSQNDYSLEAYVLGKDRYQIELLNNLDKVPEAGALVIVAFPKPKNGSGFPARVFSVFPP